ncbi:MAG: septal ring lytic transglycosylase RlpA family protein [Alphaproteobacteria bacterium]
MSRTRRLLAILLVLLFLAPLARIGGASAGERCAPRHSVKSVSCFTGVASWYGRKYQGRKTASGEPFDRNDLTAAHPFLPMQSKALVTNLATGRSVTVRINDRGPGQGRAIDLSQAAARSLGIEARGLAKVRIEEIAEGTE